jgi:hypothetical protein
MATWPKDSHRTLVIGRTGSGKSVFGLWLLSTRDISEKPWIVFDYKGDEIIAGIEDLGFPVISGTKCPTKPGLYIYRPDPENPAEVNNFLLKVWKQENTGLFFDEGFMVPQQRPYKAFDHIMTQGRSKHIPVIACYQRPAWLSQFAMSQADFFAVFQVKKPEDRETLNDYIGQAPMVIDNKSVLVDVNYKLPDHYCLWYDVAKDQATVLRPCPPPEEILDRFEAMIAKKKPGWF